MHISPPPFLFVHSCEMTVYLACLACDIIESRSTVLLIQVSVMNPLSMFANSIWPRSMFNLFMRDCILNKGINNNLFTSNI